MFGVGGGVAGASWDERESCSVGLFEWGIWTTAGLDIYISHSSASTEPQVIDVLVEIFSLNCLSYSNQLAFGFLLAPNLIV